MLNFLQALSNEIKNSKVVFKDDNVIFDVNGKEIINIKVHEKVTLREIIRIAFEKADKWLYIDETPNFFEASELEKMIYIENRLTFFINKYFFYNELAKKIIYRNKKNIILKILEKYKKKV